MAERMKLSGPNVGPATIEIDLWGTEKLTLRFEQGSLLIDIEITRESAYELASRIAEVCGKGLNDDEVRAISTDLDEIASELRHGDMIPGYAQLDTLATRLRTLIGEND